MLQLNTYKDLLLNQIFNKQIIKLKAIENGKEKIIIGTISFISDKEIMVDYDNGKKITRTRLWHYEIGSNLKDIELFDDVNDFIKNHKKYSILIFFKNFTLKYGGFMKKRHKLLLILLNYYSKKYEN